MRIRYFTVDAFTDKTFEGAQITVIPEATGLNDAQMQKIAREFNVSETVFVFPAMNPKNARKLRIFTPFKELPFAGHPTLAASYVLSTIGDISGTESFVRAGQGSMQFVFEENVGAIHSTVRSAEEKTRCEFGLRSNYSIDRYTPPDSELARIFSLTEPELKVNGYSPMVVATEYPYLVIPVSSYGAVRRAKFDYRAWNESSAPATLSHQALLFSTETELQDSGYHCRLLGPEIGVNEDPPIGSSVPAFAGYLCETSSPEHHFTAERGGGRFRRSLLEVRAQKEGASSVGVRVSGTAVLVCDGHLHL